MIHFVPRISPAIEQAKADTSSHNQLHINILTDEQKLERIYGLMDVLAENYFGSGELPIENAYGLTILARALVGQLLGCEWAEGEIENLHGHHDCSRGVFPDDFSLQNHIHGLFDLKGVLGDSEGNRDIVMFVRDGREGSELAKDGKPYLQLVPPLA